MLLVELIPKYLDLSLVRIVNGAVPQSTKVRYTSIRENSCIILHHSSFLFNGITVSTQNIITSARD